MHEIVLAICLVGAFGVIGWLAIENSRLKSAVDSRDSLIEDLKSAIGDTGEHWRHRIL